MQKFLFIIINISTCFVHLYAHLQQYRFYVTAHGVQHCKRELLLVVGFVLCRSSCCVIVGKGYAVCCIGFGCHRIRVVLSGVDGNAEVERGHGVYGCRNGCMCLVWV